MKYLQNHDITGSINITGSVNVSGNLVATASMATSASFAMSSSYAVSSSYALDINTTSETITKISNGGVAMTLVVANGRLYGLKGNDGGYNSFSATHPNSVDTGLLRGINNMYEIELPEEDSPVIDAGTLGYSNYALCENGNLYTWGENGRGQLGLGNTTDRYYPELAETSVVEVYRTINPAMSEPNTVFMVIRKTDGKVYATGENGHGQLGLGDITDRTSFTELTWCGTNPRAVWPLGGYAGNLIVEHANNNMYGTGYDGFGQLGLGSTLNERTTPVNLTAAWPGTSIPVYNVVDILYGPRFYNGSYTNAFNIIMLLSNGTTTKILGAGSNDWGSLGNGTTTNSSTPIAPTGDWSNVTKISGRGGSTQCVHALKSDGSLWLWGYNNDGQGGDGSSNNVLTPTQVTTAVQDIVSTKAPGPNYYAYQITGPLIQKEGAYYTAGKAFRGERGDGDDTLEVSSFVRIKLPKRVRIQHFTEQNHSNQQQTRIAIDTEGTFWVWGANDYQQIDESDNTNFYQPTSYKPPILKK